MDKLTPDALVTFLWVGAALVAFTLAVWSLLDKIKSARKPAEDLAEWRREVEKMLDKDNKRLNSLDEGQKAFAKSMLAIMDHLRTGNGTDKLREAQGELTEFLINR